MALPKYSQPEQTTPTTYPQADWQGLFFDSADGGKLKRIDDAGTVVSVEDISGTVGLGEGGTGADLSAGQGVLVQSTSGATVSSLGGTGILKLASGAPSVAALLRSEMPTGALFVDAAISGTLQSVEDASGNVGALSISSEQVSVAVDFSSGYQERQFEVGPYKFQAFSNDSTIMGVNMAYFPGSSTWRRILSGYCGMFNFFDGGFKYYGFSPGSADTEVSLGTPILELKNSGTVGMPNLPTSSSGLSSGDLWNDSGTVKIV
jgi:hypothetical protein